MKFVGLLVLVSIVTGLCALGCHSSAPAVSASPAPSPNNAGAAAPAPKAVPVSDSDLAKSNVNESGKVPILEYHNIADYSHVKGGARNYYRSPEEFRKDLDTLYREGYRPVSLHDLIENHIDVPLGMTPVVFTFDDSSATQFRYLPDGSVDPDCAFGILQAFHAAHPDFAMRGVFFMNASTTGQPSPVFADDSVAAKKTQELLAAGMELGNHTVTHANLRKLSDSAVQKELAGCVAGIHRLAPNVVVDTLALPFGVSPRNKELAESGEADGVQYHNRAVLLVGANPAPAPASVKFNLQRLPRIQAYPGPMGSDFWLGQFREHPKSRYISDGDPGTITVPKGSEQKIDSAKLGSAKLRIY